MQYSTYSTCQNVYSSPPRPIPSPGSPLWLSAAGISTPQVIPSSLYYHNTPTSLSGSVPFFWNVVHSLPRLFLVTKETNSNSSSRHILSHAYTNIRAHLRRLTDYVLPGSPRIPRHSSVSQLVTATEAQPLPLFGPLEPHSAQSSHTQVTCTTPPALPQPWLVWKPVDQTEPGIPLL